MVLNNEGILKNKAYNQLIQEAIYAGEIGLGTWNMTQQSMDISEKMTGLTFENKSSFPEVLELIAYAKDLDLAKNDLQDYLNGNKSEYRSNFRIKNQTGEIRWLLIKGNIYKDESSGDQILYVIFYDVTGDKLLVGNDNETNLINHEFFFRKLESTITHHEKNKLKGGVIAIELTNFRALIDIYGYDFGKKTLKEVAILLKSSITLNQELAKFPDEHFLLLSKDVTSREELEETATAVNKMFEKPLIINNSPVLLNISIGVTTFPGDSTNASELLLFTETAMKKSQEHKRNSWTYFDKELSESLHREFIIETEIPKALQEKEFSLAYQPQINTAENKVIGVEALIRWENESLGFISPGEFIPIAENTGYIIDIGHFVIEESIKIARKWLDNEYEFGKIAINISPVELINPDIVTYLLNYTKKYQVDPSYIEIEITEGICLYSVNRSLEVIQELIERGFKIAIDDFGTGYSNFIFLIQAKMHTLKIDKSIIHDVMHPKTSSVIEGLLNFATELGYEVIAEGVEEKQQVEALSALGSYNVQGYYYSKPVSASEIEQFF